MKELNLYDGIDIRLEEVIITFNEWGNRYRDDGEPIYPWSTIREIRYLTDSDIEEIGRRIVELIKLRRKTIRELNPEPHHSLATKVIDK